MKLVILIAMICTGIRASAHEPADGLIYAGLGGFTYWTHTKGENPLFAAPIAFAEADVNKYGGLEIAMSYLRNSFTVREQGKELTESLKRLYISTGYRHWFDKRWSAAILFSSSFSMGNRKTIYDDFGALARPNTSARDITEYGFDFSVQHEPWQWGRWSVVFDARYALSVTPKKNEDANHMGAYVALKYFVQARDRNPNDEEEPEE